MQTERIAIACIALAFGFAVVSVACSREVHGSRVALAGVSAPSGNAVVAAPHPAPDRNADAAPAAADAAAAQADDAMADAAID